MLGKGSMKSRFLFRFALLNLILPVIIVTKLSGESLCTIVNGASLVAQDSGNTFLGKINNSFDSKSIFNEYGTYGNEFSGSSIWNEFSTFGNQYNIYSPFNKYSLTPPMIIKSGKIIGYLTTNKSVRGGISLGLLREMCKDEL